MKSHLIRFFAEKYQKFWERGIIHITVYFSIKKSFIDNTPARSSNDKKKRIYTETFKIKVNNQLLNWERMFINSYKDINPTSNPYIPSFPRFLKTQLFSLVLLRTVFASWPHEFRSKLENYLFLFKLNRRRVEELCNKGRTAERLKTGVSAFVNFFSLFFLPSRRWIIFFLKRKWAGIEIACLKKYEWKMHTLFVRQLFGWSVYYIGEQIAT